jgi:hypothetical protein
VCGARVRTHAQHVSKCACEPTLRKDKMMSARMTHRHQMTRGCLCACQHVDLHLSSCWFRVQGDSAGAGRQGKGRKV